MHIHLSETEDEVARCVEAHGARPAEYLDRLGLLGPRTLLAHGVWLDDAELELIAARGATVVTNPVANLKLAVGRVFPYLAAREAGVHVGLGHRRGRVERLARPVPGHEDLRAAPEARGARPRRGQRRRGLGDRHRASLAAARAEGGLAQGEPADFLLLRSDAPELSLGDFTAGLVYAASGAVVDTTVVNGRVLMRGGEVEGADEVLAHALERARRLGLGR